MDEKLLLKEIKNGNLDAFSVLVKKYEKKALNFSYKMLSDMHLAEDVTQEAFLKVLKKIDTFRGASSFSTWFYTILNNLCLDILRKKSRAPDIISITRENTNDDEYELQLEDASPGPYESLQNKEIKKILEDAIKKLTPEHRAIIVLRDVEGLEYEEIAKILKISLGTVKSRLSRARLSLRKIVGNEMELFL